MNRRDDDPYGPPAVEKKGVLDETRTLFDSLLAEGMRREAEQRAERAPAGPLTKLLGFVLAIAILAAAATGVYGIATFPDAPIRATPTGYKGKTGKAYDREHYERFELWQTTLFATFGLVFLFGVAVAVDDQRRKRRGPTSPG